MVFPAVNSISVLEVEPKNISEKLFCILKEKNIQHLIFQVDNMTIALQILSAAKMAKCAAYPQYYGSPFAYLKKYPDAEKSNFEKIIFAKKRK